VLDEENELKKCAISKPGQAASFIAILSLAGGVAAQEGSNLGAVATAAEKGIGEPTIQPVHRQFHGRVPLDRAALIWQRGG
jgi:hypothetical protein